MTNRKIVEKIQRPVIATLISILLKLIRFRSVIFFFSLQVIWPLYGLRSPKLSSLCYYLYEIELIIWWWYWSKEMQICKNKYTIQMYTGKNVFSLFVCITPWNFWKTSMPYSHSRWQYWGFVWQIAYSKPVKKHIFNK